jgi:sialate O-acetylesterase
MATMVRAWRKRWDEGDLPFYYVQIAPHLYHVVRSQFVVSSQALPLLWEAQTACLRLPQTGMIVTTDLVDDLFDIHPRNKQEVGRRLALVALAKTYHRPGIVYAGPMFKSLEVQGSKAILHFDDVGGGLVSRDGKPLSWFTVAAAGGEFQPATAVIAGDTVVVSSPRVAVPAVVHFGWDEAAQPNLSTKAGLPAVPFRSDPPPIDLGP